MTHAEPLEMPEGIGAVGMAAARPASCNESLTHSLTPPLTHDHEQYTCTYTTRSQADVIGDHTSFRPPFQSLD